MTEQRVQSSRRKISGQTVAKGLGWFSIGLGLAELLMPRMLTRSLGMRGKENLLRLYGLREINTGIGILAVQRKRSPWIWGRVAGDALDIATLAPYLSNANPKKQNVAIAMGAVAAVTAVDVACAAALQQEQKPQRVARDYSDRSGFPRSPEEMRGAAHRMSFQKIPAKPEPAQPRLHS